MSVLRNLRNEWQMLISSPIKFFVPSVLTVLTGIIVWLSCDGITLVWKTSFHPSLSIPLWLMTFLCIIIYMMFEFLISIGSVCSVSAELWLKAVVAYFASLFWYPLTLLAGVGFCGVCAVVASLAYTLYILKIYAKLSLLGMIFSVCIIIYEIYLLYFTVGFTIIN